MTREKARRMLKVWLQEKEAALREQQAVSDTLSKVIGMLSGWAGDKEHLPDEMFSFNFSGINYPCKKEIEDLRYEADKKISLLEQQVRLLDDVIDELDDMEELDDYYPWLHGIYDRGVFDQLTE